MLRPRPAMHLARALRPRAAHLTLQFNYPLPAPLPLQLPMAAAFSSTPRGWSQQLSPAAFYSAVQQRGIDFFTGVPDSLLKDFCAYVTSESAPGSHVIAANEGAAVGLAAGHHLATGRPAMVYLQNSGLGNTVNPLLSLCDPAVYRLPVLLLVGWRGEPGVKDEPQHVTQGALTPAMLDCMNIPYAELPKDEAGMKMALDKMQEHFHEHNSPFAILVRKGTFESYKLQNGDDDFKAVVRREAALAAVVAALGPRDAVVATTGMLSRELFETRVAGRQGHARDFLTVGAMGHAAAIAMGVAMRKPDRQVFCLDGDGAVLMHMGSLAVAAQKGTDNFKHIVFNNGAHDSVGGQPTEAASPGFCLRTIARGCGYREVMAVDDPDEIPQAVAWLRAAKGPVMLELRCLKGSRGDLGRPTRTPIENKQDYMAFLADQ